MGTASLKGLQRGRTETSDTGARRPRHELNSRRTITSHVRLVPRSAVRDPARMSRAAVPKRFPQAVPTEIELGRRRVAKD
jgi:hypothetical protein